MVKEGFPFVFGTIFIAAIFALLYFYFGGILFPVAALAFVLLTVFMAYFFRDPRRTIPGEDGVVVSAADGRVTRIEENENGKVVSVFLSPLDVHINRAPIAGRITKIEYIRGKKNPATSDRASLINERNSLTIEGEKMTIVCTQIAGIVARRIVCWSKEGDNLELGEKFGLIKFSSRTDLLMPKNVEIMVEIGDRVVGGETIIGRLVEYSLAENISGNSLLTAQPAVS
ncbi:MAG: phosphatidylserine decarboxylase [Acidobacteriota bacterium]|nr:phosphatidylserine decarboxylase [Acidobacteriota bacterium]